MPVINEGLAPMSSLIEQKPREQGTKKSSLNIQGIMLK